MLRRRVRRLLTSVDGLLSLILYLFVALWTHTLVHDLARVTHCFIAERKTANLDAGDLQMAAQLRRTVDSYNMDISFMKRDSKLIKALLQDAAAEKKEWPADRKGPSKKWQEAFWHWISRAQVELGDTAFEFVVPGTAPSASLSYHTVSDQLDMVAQSTVFGQTWQSDFIQGIVAQRLLPTSEGKSIDLKSHRISYIHLGLRRTIGVISEGIVEPANKSNQLYHLPAVRPFLPLELGHDVDTVHLNSKLIHMVMALEGRLDKLARFLSLFAELCIVQDQRVYLTIVYFGSEGLAEVQQMLRRMSQQYAFSDYNLIARDEPFSRGKGLQIGAFSWQPSGDVLMFFTDVDVHFDQSFLDRCRLVASRGKRVYYPVVFSLYNPRLVYHRQSIPPLEEQLTITNETGFWRVFGFGMTCQYLSDFRKIGGFDMAIKGWGSEDVSLYKAYLSEKKLEVVRAADRSLFHVFHPKECSLSLSAAQKEMCVATKRVSEASHANMAYFLYTKKTT